jgi:hypothetical protein
VKYLILLALASLAAGITLAATKHPIVPCRKWQNLCIPKKYDPVLGQDFLPEHSAPDRLARFAKQLPGTDVETVPSATFEFSGDELARAISKYAAQVTQGKPFPFTFDLGVVVTIKPASLAHGERVYPTDRALYNLEGTDVLGEDFTHAVVEKLPHLPYYRVEPVFSNTHTLEDSWFMVSGDLRNKRSRPPLKPLVWKIGLCNEASSYSPALGFECTRMLADPNSPYYVQYDVKQPNVHLIPEIDAFIEAKIRSWQVSQPSQRKR